MVLNLLICRITYILIILFLFNGCVTPGIEEREDLMVIEEFEDIVSELDSNISETSLIDFVLSSKLGSRSKRLNSTKAVKKRKKARSRKTTSGLGSFKDTIIYKGVNILKADKCSLVKERKIIVRKNITLCLTRKKKLPKLNFLYSYTALKKLDADCSSSQKVIKDELRLEESRDCYRARYKNGSFISPLSIIK